MSLTEGQLRGLIDALPKNDALATALTEAIRRHDGVRLTLTAHRQKVLREEDRHRDAMKALGAELKRIREGCSHPEWVYHADPAGGSDSFHECSVCGEQR